MRSTNGGGRLHELLEGQRPAWESAIEEAEAELVALREREAQLIELIHRARVALGQQNSDAADRFRAPRVTLHDAMATVLRERGRPLTGRELADEINRRGLYRQKDGSPVPLNQVHARASNYGDLFVKEDRRIGLRS
jgi:hypothetical protein